MKPSTLFILLVVGTCHYTTTAILEEGKEKVRTGAEMVKDKAESVKESVKEGAESVKETVHEWSDKAQELWEKSGTAFRDASQSVRDGIKSLTPEFLQAPEPESKLQEWKNKASAQALKELNDAATLLDEANSQVKDIMTQGKVDAAAKMTRLRLSVDHAVRHAMRAFKSLRDQASREGVPQALVDRLKQGWTATTSAVESLKDFVVNAYNKEEDKHEIVQDLEATFKQWEKFKAAASEKLEAAKEAASDTLQATKEAASDKLQATKDAAQATKQAASDKLQATKEAASEKLQAGKEAAQDAAHAAKQAASDKLKAAKDAVNGGEL